MKVSQFANIFGAEAHRLYGPLMDFTDMLLE